MFQMAKDDVLGRIHGWQTATERAMEQILLADYLAERVGEIIQTESCPVACGLEKVEAAFLIACEEFGCSTSSPVAQRFPCLTALAGCNSPRAKALEALKSLLSYFPESIAARVMERLRAEDRVARRHLRRFSPCYAQDVRPLLASEPDSRMPLVIRFDDFLVSATWDTVGILPPVGIDVVTWRGRKNQLLFAVSYSLIGPEELRSGGYFSEVNVDLLQLLNFLDVTVRNWPSDTSVIRRNPVLVP